jgi:hypothetical protein
MPAHSPASCALAPSTTARELSEALLRKTGKESPSLPAIRTMLGGVNKSIRNHEGKTVERVGDGMPARWRIIA